MSKSLKETGNALFLILVAVALFAALSYAVTRAIQSKDGVVVEDTHSHDDVETLPTTNKTP